MSAEEAFAHLAAAGCALGVVLPRLGDDGRWHDSERASDYRLAPPDAVPTCPACAVLWAAAHEGG